MCLPDKLNTLDFLNTMCFGRHIFNGTKYLQNNAINAYVSISSTQEICCPMPCPIPRKYAAVKYRRPITQYTSRNN